MLPTSTRIVKIMEMKVDMEARKVVIFRRRVAEDSDVDERCWSIGGGGGVEGKIWGGGGGQIDVIYMDESEYRAVGYRAAFFSPARPSFSKNKSRGSPKNAGIRKGQSIAVREIYRVPGTCQWPIHNGYSLRKSRNSTVKLAIESGYCDYNVQFAFPSLTSIFYEHDEICVCNVVLAPPRATQSQEQSETAHIYSGC